ITSVAGMPVPGGAMGGFDPPDVSFASPVTNPATVLLAAMNVPTGTTVTVRTASLAGGSTSVTSTALAGTFASSTASASLNLPGGYGSLTAVATFTPTPMIRRQLGLSTLPKLDGAEVDRVEIVASAGEPARIYLGAPNGAHLEWKGR